MILKISGFLKYKKNKESIISRDADKTIPNGSHFFQLRSKEKQPVS